MDNLQKLGEMKQIVVNLGPDLDKKDKIITQLVERQNFLLDVMQTERRMGYEVESVPVTELARGKQSFTTRFLEQQAPNNELIYHEPTMITHIYRAKDDYDLIDTTLIPYNPSLVQILINNNPISNVYFDVTMLPNNPEHAYKLPTPLFVGDGTRLQLMGGAGLTNLRIGLQGYELNKCPEEGGRILQPYFLIAEILPADRSKALIIPPWMNLDITDIYSFIRVKPSDSDNAAYADYNINIASGADGNYNGSWKADVQYWHGGGGFRFMRVGTLEETHNWCGTREFPRPVHDLFPDITTSVEVLCEALTLNAGADLWRWMVLAGKFSVIKQRPR